jgi:hypothetical protein
MEDEDMWLAANAKIVNCGKILMREALWMSGGKMYEMCIDGGGRRYR